MTTPQTPKSARKEASRSVIPALAVLGGAVGAWLWVFFLALLCVAMGMKLGDVSNLRNLPTLTLQTAAPCLPIAWALSFVGIRRSRGGTRQNRSFAVASWTGATPVVWGVGLGMYVVASSGDAAAGAQIGVIGAGMAMLVWMATATPVMTYHLARAVLAGSPDTSSQPRELSMKQVLPPTRDEADEDAEIARTPG